MGNASTFGYDGTAWRPIRVDAQGRLELGADIDVGEITIGNVGISGGTVDAIAGTVLVAGTVTAVGGESAGTVAVSGGTINSLEGTATVRGTTKIVSGSITRPADTTTYAAGDEISNSTSAPTAMALTGLGRGGVITGSTMWQSANQTTAISAELWLFRGTAAPTIQNDNAAYAPGTADLANLVGIIPYSTSYNGAGTAGSGTAGNRAWVASNLNIPYETHNGGGTLWGRMVVRNAYVPVSGEVFGHQIRTLQD